MAKERTSVRMQAQIRRMAEQGYSIRSTDRILKLSRKTVRKYLETTPEEASEPVTWMGAVDWDHVLVFNSAEYTVGWGPATF